MADETVSMFAGDTSRCVTNLALVGEMGFNKISFTFMAWQNSDTAGGATDSRLVVAYNGVTYATFTTVSGAVSQNVAGLTGNWVYSAGASGPATLNSVTAAGTGALTAVSINLPAGITASGSLVFSYVPGSTGAGTDAISIDNVIATSTRTTTTVTTTADTADNNWAATYTENGPAVSIADTDSSVFDSSSANMQSGTITLTNPQTGDRLLVNGSAAASGTLASRAHAMSELVKIAAPAVDARAVCTKLRRENIVIRVRPL